jgi:hypothetical protein
MSIKDELLGVQARNPNGILDVSEVHNWAQANPSSLLHKALDWDDPHAAHAHRLWQIRQLVQLHVIDERGAPMMVSLSIDRVAGGGYRAVEDVGRAPELRAVMLADALAELERVKAKFHRISELAAVWAEADAVRQRTAKRAAAKSRVAAKKAAKPASRAQKRSGRESARASA